MNKWYKSGLAKGILIVAAHVLSVTLVISILWMASYPDVAEDMLSGKKTGNYPVSYTHLTLPTNREV